MSHYAANGNAIGNMVKDSKDSNFKNINEFKCLIYFLLCFEARSNGYVILENI